MGIDRVVTDDPRNRSRIECKRRPIEMTGSGRCPHQCTPGEGKPKPELRPPREPFHERIDRDHGERSDPDPDCEGVELYQDEEPDQGLRDHEDGRGRDADLTRGNWARTRSLDPGIKVA